MNVDDCPPCPTLDLHGLPLGWHHLAIGAHTLAAERWGSLYAPGVEALRVNRDGGDDS